MGKIKKDGKTVIVEMNLDELLIQKTYLQLPNEERLWSNHLGNLVSRAASYIIHKKAPQYSKTYDHIEITGEGTVTVTFFEEML